MKTIKREKNWRLWLTRYPYAWFEVNLEYNCHNYIVSITVATIELGFEWVWFKARNLKKNSIGWCWLRI
jgi:hypothetical protein